MQLQNKYNKFDKGLIKAWGNLLYLSYHSLQNKYNKLIDYNIYQKEIIKYYDLVDYKDLEDYNDWLSEIPPMINKLPFLIKTD